MAMITALLAVVLVVTWVRSPDPENDTNAVASADGSSTATPPAADPPSATQPPDDPAPTATSVPEPTAGPPTPTPTANVAELPLDGPGTFTSAPVTGWQAGTAPYRTFSVAVEDGLGLDPVELASFVETTLADPRSWIADGITGWERVETGGEFMLVVASPSTVDRLCLPLNTIGQLSCGNNGYIALNLHRWMTATEEWPADLLTYRQYLVNHEVGHYVLGPGHPSCPGPGELAPLMQQQTKGLDGCLPNAWPFP